VSPLHDQILDLTAGRSSDGEPSSRGRVRRAGTRLSPVDSAVAFTSPETELDLADERPTRAALVRRARFTSLPTHGWAAEAHRTAALLQTYPPYPR
jgi:hypothetical protein